MKNATEIFIHSNWNPYISFSGAQNQKIHLNYICSDYKSIFVKSSFHGCTFEKLRKYNSQKNKKSSRNLKREK